jgi:SAP domain-containing protein
MTVTQFNRGYWYAVELKDFAKTIGVPSAGTLRKDELEKAITVFLETGRIVVPTERSLSRPRSKDVERRLSLDLRVDGYTNNKETKDFLEREARRLAPGLKRKSGARYRLNRWREERIAKGLEITYRDLVEEYVRLSQTAEPFARVPHGRYINFMSDFMKAERNATRPQAVRAWKTLKTLDIPKDYRSWKRLQGGLR